MLSYNYMYNGTVFDIWGDFKIFKFFTFFFYPFLIQFNSIQYINGNSTVYWHDPINIKSTSQDKRHLVIT